MNDSSYIKNDYATSFFAKTSQRKKHLIGVPSISRYANEVFFSFKPRCAVFLKTKKRTPHFCVKSALN